MGQLGAAAQSDHRRMLEQQQRVAPRAGATGRVAGLLEPQGVRVPQPAQPFGGQFRRVNYG